MNRTIKFLKMEDSAIFLAGKIKLGKESLPNQGAYMNALDSLDQRIVAALQIDGRAPWAKIASALGEAERTVARRGADLLRDGRVRIRALPNPSRGKRLEQFVLKVTCNPGAAGISAAALARRPETFFTYILTGSADCTAELSSPASKFAELLIRDIGGIPGVSSAATYPVLNHLRTMHQWNPGVLTSGELAELGGTEYSEAPTELANPEQLNKEDRQIMRALERDGRSSYEDLARITGLSVQTAQRRVEKMRREGTLFIRAVFEPALLGLPVEVMLWVKVPFPELDRVEAEILPSPAVRYAAVLAGDFQLVVNAVFPSRAALYAYLKSSDWAVRAQSIEPALVVDALKRSGTLALSFGEELQD
ncbi:Lrp/AsnC family transcriptional regulator [Arthrobacter sp. D1-17]